MSAFSWSYVYIDFFFLNTLSGGKSCSVAPGVAVPAWATKTVLSPWMAADEARVSHVLPHVVWWKKKKKKKKKVWIKDKWSNPGKGIASSATHQCSSYWKRSLLVALDYGQPTTISIYLKKKKKEEKIWFLFTYLSWMKKRIKVFW